MRILRRFAISLVASLVMVTVLSSPQPADAAYTWYGADLRNWSFTRVDGTPFMTKQNTCYMCVASATQAWVEYTWSAAGDNGHSPANGYTQDWYWNWFEGNYGQTWGSYEVNYGDYTVLAADSCTGANYPRRYANNSRDDGVDPYGQAWGAHYNSPPAWYMHMIRYDDGPSYTGYNTATHSMGWALANYREPVGTLIGNGGHYVLAVGVEALNNPVADFWTPILNVLIRDPWLEVGGYPYTGNRKAYAYDTADLNSWARQFTRYGYVGESVTAPPYRTSGGWIDDVRTGPRAGLRASASNGYKGYWWGRYVLIKRDDTAGSPDNVDWFYAP